MNFAMRHRRERPPCGGTALQLRRTSSRNRRAATGSGSGQSRVSTDTVLHLTRIPQSAKPTRVVTLYRHILISKCQLSGARATRRGSIAVAFAELRRQPLLRDARSSDLLFIKGVRL